MSRQSRTQGSHSGTSGTEGNLGKPFWVTMSWSSSILVADQTWCQEGACHFYDPEEL